METWKRTQQYHQITIKLLRLVEAGILNHSSHLATRIATKWKLDDDPQRREYENLIINTIIKATSEGLADNTLNSIAPSLTQLSQKTDLRKPEEVKTYIANATHHKTKRPLSNATKTKLAFAYEWLCKANELQWQKPHYKVPEGILVIPTTENVTKIVLSSTRKYATIFTILVETGAEGEELHRTHRNKIDLVQKTITITGTKGHGTAIYKLKQRTAEMLTEYLTKNPQEYPFPKPKVMSEQWRTVRNRLADNLKQPELKQIPMKNLRNYSGAKLYYALPVPDPIAVMRHLRHKKLETTMHYLRGMATKTEDDSDYIVKTATNLKEATPLLEAGFQYIQEIDGIKIYRKRK